MNNWPFVIVVGPLFLNLLHKHWHFCPLVHRAGEKNDGALRGVPRPAAVQFTTVLDTSHHALHSHWTLNTPPFLTQILKTPSPLVLALLVFSDTCCQSEEKKGVKPSMIDLKICPLSFPFKLRRDVLERPLLKCKSDTHNKTQVSCLLDHATFLHRGRFKIKTKKWKCQNVSKTSKTEKLKKIVKSDRNFVKFWV